MRRIWYALTMPQLQSIDSPGPVRAGPAAGPSRQAAGREALPPAAADAPATPMMAQYLEIKAAHPDYLLF